VTRYTDDSKERVRDAVDMVDLVGTRTELRRAGANRYEGLCPFHEERTPSFGIDPAQKLFYCFGCSQGGDAFRFVQLTEGLDFKGALEYLADRYGVRLEPVEEDPAAAERRRSRERLLELLERTAAFYVRYLWDSDEAAPAREYLAGRGLDEAVLREFRVGYAPSAYDTLLRAVRRSGFSNREVYDAGLAMRSKGEGMLYDRFRRRIMFPLCDLRGRVLGFGARALGADQKPKYLNSAEGVVYHKGRHLFGADIARAAAAKAGSVIVAEGYTDVIAMHQAGLRNTVGLMGTAMTDEQVGELARLAPRVRLALDADGAGQEAMLRAATQAVKLAARRNLELRVVSLPRGADPADLVKADGARAMQRLVDAAVPFAQFHVDREIARTDLSSAREKDHLISRLKPIFAALETSALRDELLARVADRTELTAALVARLLTDTEGPAAASRVQAGPSRIEEEFHPARPSVSSLDRISRVERDFLVQCLALPSAGAEALRTLDVDEAFSDELSRRAARHLRRHLESPAEGVETSDRELMALVAHLTIRAGREHGSAATLRAETLNLELERLERQIARARRERTGAVAPLVARRERKRHERDRALEQAIAESKAPQ
jgi:DNA primase